MCGVFGFGLTPECVFDATTDQALRLLLVIAGIVLLFVSVYLLYQGHWAASALASILGLGLAAGVGAMVVEGILLVTLVLLRAGRLAAAIVVAFGGLFAAVLFGILS